MYPVNGALHLLTDFLLGDSVLPTVHVNLWYYLQIFIGITELSRRILTSHAQSGGLNLPRGNQYVSAEHHSRGTLRFLHLVLLFIYKWFQRVPATSHANYSPIIEELTSIFRFT